MILLSFLFQFQSSSASAQEGWWHPLRPPGITPTPEQAAWADLEFGMMFCLGINTWSEVGAEEYGREMTFGEVPAALFNPSRLDARQWVRVAKAAGFKYVILYTKHIDEFTLWPSSVTDYSVESSPWKGGKGDVVKEVADACRAEGLKLGLALCVMGSHSPGWVNRDNDAYNADLATMVRELLTRYGDVLTVWLDPGWQLDGRIVYYDKLYGMVKTLQPHALVSLGGIMDTGWAGNEEATSPESVWNVVSVAGYPYWLPQEANTSSRVFNWFWDPGHDDRAMTVPQIIEKFYLSVGHGTNVLINIPPDRRGLLPEVDSRNMIAAGRLWRRNFNPCRNLALNRPATASSTHNVFPGQFEQFHPGHAADGNPDTFWMARDDAPDEVSWEVDLGGRKVYDRVSLQEMIMRGQRVEGFRLENWDGRRWASVAAGTTIGHRKIVRFPPVTGSRLRVVMTKIPTAPPPTLREVGVYRWMDCPGDIDGSGAVEVGDVVCVLQCSLGLAAFTPEQDGSADVTMDGRVTVEDAVELLKETVGILPI